MIFDKTENMPFYFDGNESLKSVLKAYGDFSHAPFDSGRIDITPNKAWCNVSKYEAKNTDEIKLEAHKKFIDVQLMFDGGEKIGWAPVSDCTVTEEYDENGDIAFMTSESTQFIELKKGYFAVFFPQDAHAPCLSDGKNAFSHKLVLKVTIK